MSPPPAAGPHAHSHNHGPGHHHAHAGVGRGEVSTRLLWVLAITAVFMFAELVGGILSGSLALLADAGHMLTDVAALGLSVVAMRLSRRPPSKIGRAHV
jgi:cobalt-zinc-cadmium efflux system protein